MATRDGRTGINSISLGSDCDDTPRPEQPRAFPVVAESGLAIVGSVGYNREMLRLSSARTPHLSRRTFLRGLAVAAACSVAAPRVVLAAPEDRRFLSFLHTHTGERLDGDVLRPRWFLPGGLEALKAFPQGPQDG